MIQVWKCDHCSQVNKDPDEILNHEVICSFNKLNKYCHTCKFSYEEGYDYHIAGCEIGKNTLKGEEEGGCQWWVYKYLDEEREEKLNKIIPDI